MKQYKCDICGGQMEIDESGGFVCLYCGAKSYMTDADFRGKEEFRKNLLSYYRAEAEKKDSDYETDKLWHQNGEEILTMENGQPLTIAYMDRQFYPGCTCYIAKESVVYVFDDHRESEAFMSGLRKLVYPEADNKLKRCFPSVKMEITLQNGGAVIVSARRPNFYPAEMFAPWPSEHLAWVISRMENICCELQYSGIAFGNITPSSVWINPETHEGALFGDWRNVRSRQDGSDLVALRRTAITLAGNTAEPRQLYLFLNTRPGTDAFEDFEKWDRVIEEGFGGHRFIKM